MTEINEIKKIVEIARTDFRAQLTFGGEIVLTKVDISSLITTIESQKEEIKTFEESCEEYEEKLTKLNEEICKLQDIIEQEDNVRMRNIQMAKDIESLKAITELAVKGLKKISERAAAYRYASVGGMANDTISEIAKLSHE